MSHLACASEPGHPMNEIQRGAFETAASRFPNAKRSLSASGGALMDARFHYDLVRPGVALYGASPFDVRVEGLLPVARLTAPIVQIRDLAAGETIGYGATFAAPRAMRTATVALGYGDGFLRAAGNRGAAIVRGALCPILGRVSMDLTVLDASAAHGAAAGDRAEFFGPARAIEKAAADAGTLAYELLTDLGRRVTRVYTSEEGARPRAPGGST
jgi:alanine racemase